VLPTFTYGTGIWGGDLEFKLSLEGYREGHEDAYDGVSRQSVFFDSSVSYAIGRIWRTSHGLMLSKANFEFSTTACPPIPSSWVVSQAVSLSRHLAEQGQTPHINLRPCGKHHGDNPTNIKNHI
jgi:hypothetical protein